MSDRLTYSFGPLERRGIAGGVAAGQMAVLGAGALMAILVLDHAPSAGGATLATIICAAAGATAFAPLGGRTVHEWLPIAARFMVAKLLGRPERADPLAVLTERERSVLALMAEGLSNAAIASRLFLSEGAISKYTTTIFAKLGLAADDDTNRRVRAVLTYLGTDGQPG